MACTDVGDANPDISGIGIIISFATQAGISIILAMWSFSRSENPKRFITMLRLWFGLPINIPLHTEYRSATQLESKAATVDDLLMMISYIQIMNGITLLVAAIVQDKTLSLYHKHIVYDTVNFTGVSFCAALGNLSRNGKPRRTTHYLTVLVFSVLYLVFSIKFGKGLEQWDDNSSGRCYTTTGISATNASHPYVDHIYLGITCLYLFVSLSGVILANIRLPVLLEATQFWSPLKVIISVISRPQLLFFAMLQYPLHLYMLITLRVSNQGSLVGGSENTWGFGQIVALTLLAATIMECIRGILRLSEASSNLLKKWNVELEQL
jgi:hypothetical protein